MKKMELPIGAFRQEILDSIANNNIVIIRAETGAGKSTQVPQFLMEAGYQVAVTQPRRLAARTVAERVAEEVGCVLGSQVGFRTGFERLDSLETQVLFCTDGLQLIREITGQGRAQALIIDEVHEWNINIETLVAWTHQQLVAGWNIKVVLMSATLEVDKLVDFYGQNVPVIDVPGRLFPVVTKEDHESNLISNIKRLIDEGRNVLVFQPGKKEIAETCRLLESCDAEVLPLHGQLESVEQRRCFRNYDRPKVVVATNVAQTSITIPDIDAVVDSGIERRVELSDGIEGLYLKPISQADCQQRKGRAGRTKDGIYILCSDYSLSERPTFPTAEIERSRLDQLVLRLASVGIDATELSFFHQPDISVLKEAKRALFALGAMTSEGQVTKIGRMMAKLPVSVQFSRMIIEAEKLGVVNDVITIAAILEIGGIHDRSDKWKEFTQEKDSDLLAELDLWNTAKEIRGVKSKDLKEMGIFTKSYFRAKELRYKISQSLRGLIRFGSFGNRELIKRACVAGMVDHLFKNRYGDYQNGDGTERMKARESVIDGSPDWIVGLPKDIQFKNRRGILCTLNLVSMMTRVDPLWLTEVAPQLVRVEKGLDPYFDSEQDSCVSTTKIYFQDQMIKEKIVATPEHALANQKFISWLASRMEDGIRVPEKLRVVVKHNLRIQEQITNLNIRAGEDIFKEISNSECQEWLTERLEGVRSVKEITNFDSLLFPELDSDLVQKVLDNNPEVLVVEGQTLTIEYGKDYRRKFARTIVEEEFARNVNIGSIVLPSDRTVEIYCNNCSAKSFKELVEQLEEVRIEKSWKEKRSELEITSWISDPEKIFPYLSKLLVEVEIAKTNNGLGDPIFGYFSLYSYSDSSFQIRIRESLEEAEKETKVGLDRLLKKSCRDALVIPKEEPWQQYRHYSWFFTELGEALKNKFQRLIEDVENLTSNNVEEKIETLKQSLKTAKNEIGREYQTTKDIIEKTDSSLKLKIENLEDQDKELANLEIKEAKGLIIQANILLSHGEYEKAKSNCEEIDSIWQNIENKVSARQSRIDRGEILVNFGVRHRRRGITGQGDGWVICLDGSIRKPDSDSIPRHGGDGHYYWDLVSEEELALSWFCKTTRDIVGSSRFVVEKFPVKGLTEAQKETVRKIELEDIRTMENSFGLDPEAGKRQDDLLNEISELFKNCPACGERIFFDKSAYLSLIGDYGMHICQNDRKIFRLVDTDKPFDQSTEGRSAQVVYYKKLSNGVLECLAYEKWGGWNLNLRWREATFEDEKVVLKTTTENREESENSFLFESGRDFKCSCGCYERVTKSEMRRYKSGESLKITCSVCGKKGVVNAS